MNFNVDRLWNQVLVEPEEVLRLIPPNSNHALLHLLFLFAYRVLLERNKIKANEIYHNIVKLEGTTIAKIFRIECLKKSLQAENKILQGESELVNCFEHWQKKIKSEKENQLIELLSFPKDDKMSFLRANQLFHLFFIDCVAADLLGVIFRTKLTQKEFDLSIKQERSIMLQKIDTQQIIKILKVSIPSVLHLFKLKQNQLPFTLRKHKNSLLYSQKTLQWILKKSNKLAYFNKILLEALLAKGQLNFRQQLQMTRIVFRYFYAYHQQRKMMSVQLLFQTYNKIDGPVRFALASQFSVLLEVAEKVGKGKMVQSMASKSKWIQELIQKKISSQQQSLYQNSASLSYGQTISLKPNEDSIKYFEVIDQYSIVSFIISCQSEFQLQISRFSNFEGSQFEEVIVGSRKTKVFTERIVFKKAGVYKVSLSNSISWITTKKVLYDLSILSPIELQSQNPQTQNWKAQYISLGKYPPLPINKLTYQQKNLSAQVHIYKGEDKYRFEIIPLKDSTRNSQVYQSDNQQRFLEKISSIFKVKQQLLFILKDGSNGERQVGSFQELNNQFRSKSETKQKSIVIEIAIKQDLN